jgi:hypothetical protein
VSIPRDCGDSTTVRRLLLAGKPRESFCLPGWGAGGKYFRIWIGGMPPLACDPRRCAALPGAQLVREGPALLGPDPSIYTYSQETVQRNLYRIPIP